MKPSNCNCQMKMTNREDICGDPTCDSRLAALLAVHLVGQILDDACVIANATVESGQPWQYQSMIKSKQPSETDNDDALYKGEGDTVNENKLEPVANVVATSTPQKVAGNSLKYTLEETVLNSQGDVDLKMHQDDFGKSTSMFINHICDMSGVEKIIEYNDTGIIQRNSEPDELIEAVETIINSYLNIALNNASDQDEPEGVLGCPEENSASIDQSEYSFLSDAFVADIAQDNITFYKHDSDDAVGINNNNGEITYIIPSVQIHEEISEECRTKNDVARFENAYLSLNRDYEQSIEEDGNIIIEDTKNMTFQEVELLTTDSSDENLPAHNEVESQDNREKSKELTAISTVSAASKKSLVSRCRSQGARLLTCLRGWWHRKTPGKRKEHRVAGGVRGLCPLSPDARRRAASLIDQRVIRSPSPSRPVAWKFNTINESMVNPSDWKEYIFDEKPHESGEG